MKILAFYLPQFHQIPENDRWWGEGFTEWTNVRNVEPLFPGHEVPEEPGELGYYDLTDGAVRVEQARLAASHGLSGFCYFHYWFHGRRLLSGPLDALLDSGEPDFPFCLCWANENWTRTWDGFDRDLLIHQGYSRVDDVEHVDWLLSKPLIDSRYIRINGKPLFIIYRAGSLPDPRQTAAVWRERARAAGLPGLYLCAVQRTQRERFDPQSIGFDSAVEFQPDWSMVGPRLGYPPKLRVLVKAGLYKPLCRLLLKWGLIDPKFAAAGVYSYDELMRRAMSARRPSYVRFPCVLPSWDNSPRRRSSGATIFLGSNPEKFERWLRHALRQASSYREQEKIVFVNAWNEWGEGNHLEPSVRWGRSYLEAVSRAVGDLGRHSSF